MRPTEIFQAKYNNGITISQMCRDTSAFQYVFSVSFDIVKLWHDSDRGDYDYYDMKTFSSKKYQYKFDKEYGYGRTHGPFYIAQSTQTQAFNQHHNLNRSVFTKLKRNHEYEVDIEDDDYYAKSRSRMRKYVYQNMKKGKKL